MHGIVIHVVASACYAALALHFWSTRWRQRPGEPRSAELKAWERAALLVPLAIHGVLLYAHFVAPGQPRFGFAYALSATLWLVVLIYWCESYFVSLQGILPPALALAALCAPLTAWFPGLEQVITPIEFRLHLLLSIFATGVLTVALLHALLMTVVDRALHAAGDRLHVSQAGSVLAGPLAGLPPLLTLERLLFRLIWVAFVFLTLTLATGLTLSEVRFGKALRFTHETVFALVAWATFAILLAGRHLYGWRGRTALRWTLAGFMFVILANIGSTFVLEVILGRT